MLSKNNDEVLEKEEYRKEVKKMVLKEMKESQNFEEEEISDVEIEETVEFLIGKMNGENEKNFRDYDSDDDEEFREEMDDGW